LQIYADLKIKDQSIHWKTVIKSKKNVESLGGLSQASVEGTTHSVKKEDQTAFADWINR
jgi:plastin-3